MKFKQHFIIVICIMAFITFVSTVTWSIFSFVFLNTCGPSDLYEKPLSYTWNINTSRMRLNTQQLVVWNETKEENGKEVELTTTSGTRFYVIERGMDQYVEGGVKWSDTTVDKIEKRMHEKKRENIKVTKLCFRGKDTFKTEFTDSDFDIEHYYMKVDNERALLFVKIGHKNSETEQDKKEWELILNSAELK